MPERKMCKIHNRYLVNGKCSICDFEILQEEFDLKNDDKHMCCICKRKITSYVDRNEKHFDIAPKKGSEDTIEGTICGDCADELKSKKEKI